MFAVLGRLRNAAKASAALIGFVALAACEPITLPTPGAGSPGPTADTTQPVKVALLVPRGSGVAALDNIAASLENAARLAASDLNGVETEITVYDTQRNTQVAVNSAKQAVAAGADIILGPLDGEAAAAVGVTVAPAGINVLTFSNNTAIAGGNVFLLGQTFEDSANTVARFAKSQGKERAVIMHSDDVAGQAGRDAANKALKANGIAVAGAVPYPLSVEGVSAAASAAAATIKSSSADTIFLTSDPAGTLSFEAEFLPERGVNPATTQYLGLTRWDAVPQLFTLPGIPGGWFAMPDTARESAFRSRYEAANGSRPHILASTAYDGMAAIGALWAKGGKRPLSASSLTQRSGFNGSMGILRLRADGSNERGLAIGTIQGGQLQILQAAPSSFGSAGS